MTKGWMLDTNICIHLMRRRAPELIGQFEARANQIYISSITLAELSFGVMRSSQKAREEGRMAELLALVDVLPFGAAAAARYGQVRADLERRGQPIGALDTLIAAHALAEGMTLVTNNRREFDRVTALAVEDWFAA
jgi:tRNA(fMet)-specific endonuclease VapC